MNAVHCPPTHVPGCLRALLASRFKAHLAGSWGTGEAHLPRHRSGPIVSFSDVDVLVDAPASDDRTAEIVRDVALLAHSHGVGVSKVSVRCRAEIDAFWNPSHVSVVAQSPVESGRFLTFWALIGAIETLSSPAQTSEAGRAYLLIKFFFKLCRNTLLVRGATPASYKALTLAMRERFGSHSALLRAYHIKLGREQSMPRGMCAALLSDAAWSPVVDAMVDAQSAQLLAGLRGDFDAWYRRGQSLHLERYVAEINALHDAPERAPARIKALNDHRR